MNNRYLRHGKGGLAYCFWCFEIIYCTLWQSQSPTFKKIKNGQCAYSNKFAKGSLAAEEAARVNA